MFSQQGSSCTDAHREKKEGEEEVVVKESLFAHTRGSKGSMPICTEAVQRLYRGCTEAVAVEGGAAAAARGAFLTLLSPYFRGGSS